MTTPAIVTIGRKDYQLAPLVFDQMERAWPFLQKHSNPTKPEELESLGFEELRRREVEAAVDALYIVSIALEGNTEALNMGFTIPVELAEQAERKPADYKAAHDAAVVKMKRTMIAGEIMGLRTSISNLMADSGLTIMGNVTTELDQIMDSLQAQMQLGLTATSEPSLDFSSLVESKEVAGT